MNPHAVSDVLKKVQLGGELTHNHTLRSAVTTAWGVDWNEDYIARDLMQNFFDANRNRLNDITIRDVGPHVVVAAPTPFKLERLFYLGSEKGDDDVGQYGEGFKVAATCLLRDHGATPVALSGNDVVVLRTSDTRVADTKMSPIEYDFFTSSRTVDGTVLVLADCSDKLKSAMQQGLTHFFYDGNPLLGELVSSTDRSQAAIYKSTNGQGHIFYRNLKRGEIDDIPIVLVINKKYQAMETKIGKDRDRNAFGAEVLESFYNCFVKYGLAAWYYDNGTRAILEAAKKRWEKGHPLLHALARQIMTPWRTELTNDLFQDKYFASSSTDRDPRPEVQLQRDQIEQRWIDQGRIRLPVYFFRFGVASASEEIKRRQQKALEESKRNNQRSPTKAEYEAIHLLGRILKEFAPEIVAVFEQGRTSYTVAKTETLLGQLKDGRTYKSRDVFLAESVFVDEFPVAVATFLHEHSHIFGYDGSRGFTDALTMLLETVIRQRQALDPLEQAWEKVRKSVRRERRSEPEHDVGLGKWLDEMDEDQLRVTLRQVPPSILKGLRKHSRETNSEE